MIGTQRERESAKDSRCAKRMIKGTEKGGGGGVQEIDLWGLESNCNGIVFPPISSTASKLLIDRGEMRPPIPEAHPAVTAQDGHREEGEITQHMWGLFYFAAKAKAKSPGWDLASSPYSIK